MKKFLKIAGIGIGALIAFILILAPFGMIGMKKMRQYEIPEVNLQAIDDGSYTGESTISRWAVAVSVTVKDHKITAISLTDKKKSNISQDIIAQSNQEIMAHQTPNIDAVGGASYTSKGYLIAVADALTKGAAR